MAQIRTREELAQALKQVVMKQRAVLLLAGVVTTLAVGIGIVLLLSFIASVVVLPVPVKLTLLIFALGTLGYFAFKYIRRAIGYGSIDAVAVALEQKHPSLKGVLIAAVQFSRMGSQTGFSDDLVRMTETLALKEAGDIRLEEVVPFAPLVKSSKTFGLAAVAAIALVVFAPGLFTRGYEVFSDPLTKVAPPLGYQVVAFPGNTQWIKFRDITIGAAIFGDHLPEKGAIFHRFAGGSWQKTDVDLRSVTKALSIRGDSLTAAFTLRQVSRSFDYYVQAGDITTDVQQVDVVDRPRVNGIKVSVFPPAYTKLPPTVVDENNGSFSAIVGSRVTLRLETNAPMKTAELQFADSTSGVLPLTITDRYAEGNLVVGASQSYHIKLSDELGETNPDPIEYYVTAVPDEYPTIDVLYPGYDVNLNADMLLPLKVRIFDDFGFSSLVMKFKTMSQGKLSEEHVAVLHYSESIKTEGDVEFNWNVETIGLTPGDYVGYYFEVADNDAISGPKITRSRQFVARVPSLDELVNESEQESTQRVQKTEDFVSQAKDLNQRLQAATRKMQAEAKTNNGSKEWEDKKELEAITDKNNELMNNIQQLSQEMDKSIDKMQDNALLSREIMEKMNQVQKLFSEVATPEMKEAQKKLMDALKTMDPNELKKAMENYNMTQKDMLERLERTLALLKKMQVEQKMEAMMRQMEELVKKQEMANNATDETKDPKQLSPLSEKADQNRQELEKMKQDAKELDQMMQDAKMQENKEAKKFSDALKETDAEKNLEQMSNQLKQQNKSEASNEGKEAKKKMMSILSQMQSTMASMKGQNSEEFANKMKNMIQDANELSQSQEDMMQNAAAMNTMSSALRDIAHSQQDLAEASSSLETQIAELGKASPFVAAELQGLVKNAVQSMNQAADQLTNTQGNQATSNQRDAMASLNKASQRLLESLDQQKQCDKGGSCDKNVSKLESMCNRQQKLNQQTQGQCNNPGGANPKLGNGSSGRAELQRMAGEQASIRKSLEDLNDEFGGSRQILGRLDDISKEMQKVEEAMESGNVGQETVERQLNIYSRMLEASRSMQRKDFTEQRKAETAQNVAPFVPPSFSSDILNDRANIEDRLREFLNGNYPPQYKEQVKAYFRTLLEAESGAKPVQAAPQTGQ